MPRRGAGSMIVRISISGNYRAGAGVRKYPSNEIYNLSCGTIRSSKHAARKLSLACCIQARYIRRLRNCENGFRGYGGDEWTERVSISLVLLAPVPLILLSSVISLWFPSSVKQFVTTALRYLSLRWIASVSCSREERNTEWNFFLTLQKND